MRYTALHSMSDDDLGFLPLVSVGMDTWGVCTYARAIAIFQWKWIAAELAVLISIHEFWSTVLNRRSSLLLSISYGSSKKSICVIG